MAFRRWFFHIISILRGLELLGFQYFLWHNCNITHFSLIYDNIWTWEKRYFFGLAKYFSIFSLLFFSLCIYATEVWLSKCFYKQIMLMSSAEPVNFSPMPCITLRYSTIRIPFLFKSFNFTIKEINFTIKRKYVRSQGTLERMCRD